jgi:cell filamentation protein
MKKRVTPANKAAKKTAATGGFVIGHARFSKISAVEGIVLVPNMKARKSRLDRNGGHGRRTPCGDYQGLQALNRGMYEVEDDTYCYPGTTVLKNKLDLKHAAELAEFEAEITDQRAGEPP